LASREISVNKPSLRCSPRPHSDALQDSPPREFHVAVQRRQRDWDSSGQGFRSGGWNGALTKGIEARLAQRKTVYYSAYWIAQLYAELGKKDKAFQWLNTAYQERNEPLMGLKTDFTLDAIRSDPRFAELVRKVGLP
jgi:hypothetical protein